MVPAFVKNLIDTRKGPVDPFGDRFTTKPKASSPSLRAVVREAQKVECLRLAHPALAAVHHREPAKLHEAGLVGVEAETETSQPFPEIAEVLLRIPLMLKSNNEIVGITPWNARSKPQATAGYWSPLPDPDPSEQGWRWSLMNGKLHHRY